MKKYFLILFLSLSMGLSAQVRLGSSASDVNSEFSDSRYEKKSGYIDDIYYIDFKADRATVTHIFDNSSVAVMVFVYPNDQGALNYYVEMYNEKYVAVSDKEWKMYSKDGGIANISLIFDEDGYFFRWVDVNFVTKLQETANNESEGKQPISESTTWAGSGFAIGDKLVATNYHVVEGSNSLLVCGANGNVNDNYTAEVIAADKFNDLAILKITDDRFNGFGLIKYGFNTNTVDVGTNVFVLGYPLTDSMGTDVKLTDGLISAKTGFHGDVSQYQISAPVQSGNSGGPLFDDSGNIIGVINAKHAAAENVGYAIKLSYLKNLIESTNKSISLSSHNTIQSYSLPDKIKAISPFVVMIKGVDEKQEVQNRESSSSDYSFINPYVETQVSGPLGNLNVIAVRFIGDKTVVAVEYITAPSMKGGWISMSSSTEIIANNNRYRSKIENWAFLDAESGELSPLAFDEQYDVEPNARYVLCLIFPLIHKDISVIDIIENIDSKGAFNWKGIHLVRKNNE